jgi:FkbM family methyltransferase
MLSCCQSAGACFGSFEWLVVEISRATVHEIKSMLQRIVSHLRWWLGLTPEANSKRALLRCGLGPGKVAVDCGANVGEMTEVMASTGAEVYAFEPNPHAFRKLAERFSNHPRVHCLNKAVGCRNETARLYFHEQSPEDEVLWSNGSSLLSEKPNVSTDRYSEVEVVDLAEFLNTFDQRICVLKMDVEGMEVALIEHLLDHRLESRVETALIETHENKIPSLAEPTRQLKLKLHERGIRHFHLDWV